MIAVAYGLCMASCQRDIGQGKIITLAEEWFAFCGCQGVGETVTEIQSCGVVALAKPLPNPACSLCMGEGYWLQLEPGRFQKQVKFMTTDGTRPTLDHHGRFQKVCDRHTAMGCFGYRPRIVLGIRLIKQHGKQG